MPLRDIIKVLVVDDMSVSRGLLQQALEENGIKNVRYATDGEDAILNLRDSPAHLAISDYNMPKMDGLQLLSQVRRTPATRKIGFILVTGTENRSVIEEGKRLGMNNYLRKPFTPNSLKECVEKVTGAL